MKQFIFLLATFLFCLSASSQVKEGKIIYEQKVDMWRRIPAENVQMRSMVPQYRTSKFELYFGNNQSFYKAIEEEPDITQENSGVVIRMGAENEYYKNFTSQKAIDKRDLMGDFFIVEDSIRSFIWKPEEGETKTILGYTCKKATGKTERGSEIVAWYSEEIIPSSGPEQFNGLPGMILGVDANKGEIVFSAIQIEKKTDEKMIKAPSKGKKISKEDFAKKQKELLGDGSRPVRIMNN